MSEQPSDERLNALVDGELTPADAEELLERLRTDVALRERLGQLGLGKHLVRHAYAGQAPSRPAPPVQPHLHRWRAGVAGAVLVGCGALLGWVLRDGAVLPMEGPPQMAGTPGASPGHAVQHVVLHLSSADVLSGLAVLERAEGILDTARSSGRQVAVEIVANAGGLDLLRAGVSPHAQRIARLRADHPALVLVACGQTAQRLRESGTEVQMLPGVVTATSALDEIVLRMQLGWTYVRL